MIRAPPPLASECLTRGDREDPFVDADGVVLPPGPFHFFSLDQQSPDERISGGILVVAVSLLELPHGFVQETSFSQHLAQQESGFQMVWIGLKRSPSME